MVGQESGEPPRVPSSTVYRPSSKLAHYYDLEYRDYADDLDFYVQLARWLDPAMEGGVLELGCGTGRVALALAAEGFRATGVDSSADMLEICGYHAGEQGVAARVELVQTDMRDLAPLAGRRYSLAICALNTFAYLTSTADQLAVLQGVRALLHDDCILALDLTPPTPDTLVPANGELVHQGSFADEGGGILHKFVTGTLDYATQTHSVTLLYDYAAPDGTLSRTAQPVIFRWTGRYEMELLLRLSGFRVESLYGDYDLNEFRGGSERMIFVARTA